MANLFSRNFQKLIDNMFSGGNITTLNLKDPAPIESPRFRRAEESYRLLSEHTNFENSSYVGSQMASKQADLYEKTFNVPESRKREFRQLKELIADEPMIDAGLCILAYGATGPGCTYIYKHDEKNTTIRQGRGVELIEKAKELMQPEYGQATYENIFFGDGYYQIVGDGKLDGDNNQGLKTIVRMPVEGMERLSNHRDEFDDPKRAYRQRDTLSREEYAYFSDFQLVHSRYRKMTGERYGRSILFAARQSIRDAIVGYAQLKKLQLRLMPIATYYTKDGNNQPLSGRALERFKFGPLGSNDAIPEIRAQRGDTNAIENPYPYRFVNGNGEFKLATATVQIKEILQMLTALIDRALATLSVPRALITGDVVNFATMSALLKHLYAIQEVLAKWFELAVIRPINDRVLLLGGILPQEIDYEVSWGQRLTNEELQFNAQTFVDAFYKGCWPLEATVEALAQLASRKDVNKIMAQLMDDRRKGLVPYLNQAFIPIIGGNGNATQPTNPNNPNDPNNPNMARGINRVPVKEANNTDQEVNESLADLMDQFNHLKSMLELENAPIR